MIWVVLLVAAAAIGFSHAVRSYLRLASATVESARAEALADAGVGIAVLDLLDAGRLPGRPGRWRVAGGPVACSAPDGTRLEISIEDEAGKVDLNSAGESLLRAMLVGLDVGPSRAAALAASIVAFRGGEGGSGPPVRSPEWQSETERPRPPKGSPFDSIHELDQVAGMDGDLLARLRPHVTIYSQQPGIDPSRARPDLIELLAAGEGGRAVTPDAAPASPGGLVERRSSLPASFVSRAQHRLLTVRSLARLASGGVFVREAVVQLAPSPSASHAFKTWRPGSATPADPDIADAGPC